MLINYVATRIFRGNKLIYYDLFEVNFLTGGNKGNTSLFRKSATSKHMLRHMTRVVLYVVSVSVRSAKTSAKTLDIFMYN